MSTFDVHFRLLTAPNKAHVWKEADQKLPWHWVAPYGPGKGFLEGFSASWAEAFTHAFVAANLITRRRAS